MKQKGQIAGFAFINPSSRDLDSKWEINVVADFDQKKISFYILDILVENYLRVTQIRKVLRDFWKIERKREREREREREGGGNAQHVHDKIF